MIQTDLKFFTNEPERDLYRRFSAILKSNTKFFDVLVGYFRASGFFKLYDSLKSVDKIRILVGLNVDRFTVKVIDRATNEAKLVGISSSDGKEIIGEEIEKEFEAAGSSEEVEKGVRIFLDWLKSGKLEMRMYTDAPIHAKVYIPAKVSKDVLKKSKLVSDVLELYYEILKLIPETYFEEKSKQGAQVEGVKQVVLSCYLKAEV